MAENREVVELGNGDSNCSATPSSSSVYYSARIEELVQSKTDYETALDSEITASRVHWSELQQPSSVAEDSSDGEKGEAPQTNSEIVLSLRKQFPQTGNFFYDWGDSIVLGKKIAEGGQAEIFEAEYNIGTQFVLKVFKEGSLVRDLQKQWPLGMLNPRSRPHSGLYVSSLCSPVCRGTVVMNGRFAFQMLQFVGDLRKLIDKRMLERNGNRFCAPFSDEELIINMLCIAMGMQGLHKDDIVHRDLKASNVLIQLIGGDRLEDLDSLSPDRLWYLGRVAALGGKIRLEDLVSLPPASYLCRVADYECSVGVVGTAFWRAPEILQGVKDRKITEDLFTKEGDVYSYAMTCYEMITGKLPFEGVPINDYDVVLRGDRPTLPEETKPWIRTLLSRCWHPNPKERPSFHEIVNCIEGHW